MDQQRSRNATFIGGSLVAAIATLAILFLIHTFPVRIAYDVGSQPAPISNLFDAEQNASMSHAYSQGQSLIREPMIGIGAYEVRVRMGSPGERDPLPVTITIGGEEIAIGTVGTVRVYHFFVPTNTYGSLALLVRSATVQPPDDPRQLGVLFDYLDIRSIGWRLPSLLTLVVALIMFGSGWITVALIGGRNAWSVALLAPVSIGAGGIAWLVRSQNDPVALWFLAGMVMTAFGALVVRPPSWLVRRTLLAAALLVGMWRVALWIVAWAALNTSDRLAPLAQHVVSSIDSEVRAPVTFMQVVSTAWSHWDSRLYLSIVTHGYQHPPEEHANMAFLPLYPFLIRALLPLTGGDAVLAGMIVVHCALIAAVLLFADVVARDFGEQVAYRAVATLLCFPTSFFLGAVYTESVALALLALVLWGLRRKRWMLAGVAGFFLSLTRLPGVLIAPVLALMALKQTGWRLPPLTRAHLTPLLPALGISLFMAYQWQRFGSPFIFLQTQRDIWDQQLSPPWVQLFMMIDTIATGSTHWSGHWPTRVFQLGVWLLFAGLAAAALCRLTPAYSLTAVMMLLPAYLTNVSHSLPRYVLLALPAFLVMALLIERHPALLAAIPVALILLTYMTALFVNGFFVG
ncbi:MAG: hypothetical protein ACUVSY_01005 [Roseiflexus sp.]